MTADETHLYVTIADRGTFRLDFKEIAGSGGVVECTYSGTVYVEHEAGDKGWDFINRSVSLVKAELGINNA